MHSTGAFIPLPDVATHNCLSPMVVNRQLQQRFHTPFYQLPLFKNDNPLTFRSKQLDTKRFLLTALLE